MKRPLRLACAAFRSARSSARNARQARTVTQHRGPFQRARRNRRGRSLDVLARPREHLCGLVEREQVARTEHTSPDALPRMDDGQRLRRIMLDLRAHRVTVAYNFGMASDAERRWVEQWRRAAVALEEQRRAELRAMSDRDALAASEALLSMALVIPLKPERITDSGLVQQQSLFHRRRR